MRKIYDISARLYDNYIVSAVRNGLLLTFPLILIGSFAALFQSVLAGILGEQWITTFQFISGISIEIVSAALTVSISYCMAVGIGKSSNRSGTILPVIPAIVSLMCYFALTLTISGEQSLYLMNAGGLPAAIFTGLVSVRLFTLLYDALRKRINAASLDSNRNVTMVLLSIIPAFTVVMVFKMFRFAFASLGYSDSNNALSSWFVSWFENIGGVFAKSVLYVLIVHFLWFFGIHGNMMLGPVMATIIDNASAVEQIKIISAASANYTPGQLVLTFFSVYVFIGGIGSTICLLAAIIITKRKGSSAKLARISLLPAIFNINEIVVFGLPIILNPIFLIPFMLCPIIMLMISYLATISGLVPPVSQSVYWAVPPLFNAYMASGSIMGPIVQLVGIAMGTLLYIPFVKLNEKIVSDRERDTYLSMKKQIEECRYGDGLLFLRKNDAVGFLAYMLFGELKEAIREDKLLLEYQPLVNDKPGVIGFEALLRWPHEKFGRIPPQCDSSHCRRVWMHG